MELFDEDLKTNKKTDNRRTTTIILALIICIIIMVLLVIGAIIYIKQTTLTVRLNGANSNTIKNMLIIEENNKQKVYVPIKQIAKSLGYNDYNGSYTTKSEETNQCYVECEDEVAMFSLGSKEIYKTLVKEEASFQCFTIDEPVKAINGELYTTIDGIEKAFNVSWNNDTENHKMEIYTMPYLISSYSSSIASSGYTVSENFTNQKAILSGMLIVEKNSDNSNKKLAVLSVNNGQIQTILEPKYDEISYLEYTQDFLVTADKKKGIISNMRKTKVKLQYDDIKLMDYNKKLYAVQISGKYGIINFNGEKILDADFSEIGIDISNFKENDIRSKYIIVDNMIPIKRDKLWAFFDTNGNQLTDFKYDNIGYITSNNRAGSGYSLLAVPEYNVVIVGKDKKYSVITSRGEEIEGMPFVFDSIYLSIYGGKTSYLLEYDTKTINLETQLDGLGYGKNSINFQKNNEQQNNSSVQENNNEENSNNNTTNQEEQNNNQNDNQNNTENNNNDNNSQNNDSQNNNNNDNNENSNDSNSDNNESNNNQASENNNDNNSEENN